VAIMTIFSCLANYFGLMANRQSETQTHDGGDDDPDAQALMDADLAILGAGNAMK
jgi:predicted metal-dependent HD superfamily phosphohydrolase